MNKKFIIGDFRLPILNNLTCLSILQKFTENSRGPAIFLKLIEINNFYG